MRLTGTCRSAVRQSAKLVGSLLAIGFALSSHAVRASESGVTFWVPGFFGSLAATPLQPGFSYANIYYNWNGQAGADVAFARQVHAGRLTVPFAGNLTANLHANASLNFAIPSYTFEHKISGRRRRC